MLQCGGGARLTREHKFIRSRKQARRAEAQVHLARRRQLKTSGHRKHNWQFVARKPRLDLMSDSSSRCCVRAAAGRVVLSEC